MRDISGPTFGQVVAEKRMALGLSESDVANATKIAIEDVAAIEADEKDPRDVVLLYRLSAILQCGMHDLATVARYHEQYRQRRLQKSVATAA